MSADSLHVMLFDFTDDQSLLVLSAAHTVVRDRTPADTDPRIGLGDAMIVAAGHLMLGPDVTVDPEELPAASPAQVAAAFPLDSDAARHAAALIACACLVDGQADPDRMLRAAAYAEALGLTGGWVADIVDVAQGHMDWAMADMARRNAETFPGWAPPGGGMADLTPYKDGHADERLADRYRALEELPHGTFGHSFWAHFRRHGFGFPGEADALAEQFSTPHDSLHVLSGYSTSYQGEILVSTFTGAMHRDEPLRTHILPVIFEWHVGQDLVGYGAYEGALEPTRFLAAWQRGEAMGADVLSPDWDFWALIERELDEVRADYRIPGLPDDLAATGPEITVPDKADPDAV